MHSIDQLGISVIIPTARSSQSSQASLESVIYSVAQYPGPKQVILCMDREFKSHQNLEEAIRQDSLYEFTEKYPWVEIVINRTAVRGAARARKVGLSFAKYEILLFTDDDCLVHETWATRLALGTLENGAATGKIVSSQAGNIFPRFEEHIDHYRMNVKDTLGGNKFCSFACLGIQKELLPPIPFDDDESFIADDMDLSCRLRLNGDRIFVDHGLIVPTEYPRHFFAAVARKIRHAKGIAYLRKRMGERAWHHLEIGNHSKIFKRWTKLSFNAPFRSHERFLFFTVNMFYCVGLVYYSWYFKKTKAMSPRDVYRGYALENEPMIRPGLTQMAQTTSSARSISSAVLKP